MEKMAYIADEFPIGDNVLLFKLKETRVGENIF